MATGAHTWLGLTTVNCLSPLVDNPNRLRLASAALSRLRQGDAWTNWTASARVTVATAQVATREEAQTKFLEALADGHTATKAAGIAGVARASLYNWREQDEEFAEAWNHAVISGTDVLEDEAFDRAVNGVPVEIYGKDGELVKTTFDKSDRLLEFLLRARAPERFRERHTVDHTGGQRHEVAITVESEQAQRVLASLEAAGVIKPPTRRELEA